MNKKNKLNKIIEEKKANSLNKKLRYGLRKLSIGVVSCFLGYAIALTPNLSYANTESNTVVASNQAEKTTKDESKTTQKENKDLSQGKTVSPVGQVDHSDLSTNKVTEKSTTQKFSMVNPIEKTEDKVEKMNTQYTVTYGPGLAYVGEGTTVNISFKQKNSKVNVPAGTTFELAANSAKGATVDKNTGKISYTPDSTVLKDGEKEKT
ncbi:YSIRK type signal peptide [Finegoldia magna SY403409CC001050417]|uniref:Rib/alpha-like domain-containing protein n=1 Tax=Finegoldia magna TaxID=1260 RepID=UPI00021A3B7A|nr:Rib/alpha-like domain-containing protein [Finegoldia magna]EGS35261.1 YSIRK type signal peptide [Finegoldia magna SY403409CC001050417]